MKSKDASKKIMIVVCVILVTIVLFSNIAWCIFYMKEKNNLRHSIMPVTQGDYYQEQLALVNNYELLKKEIGSTVEYEEKAKYIASNLDRISYQENNKAKKTVPFIKQNPNYPNGCESVSAVMLLQSYGIDIKVDEFINRYLKKNVIYSKDGDRYGPDPRNTYAGEPRSETMGFGVFEPGIKLAIEKVLYDKTEEKINYNVYGSDDKKTLEYQVANKLPLVIWATTNYEPVGEMWTWRSYDKKYTYTYPKNSHTIVVTGVDQEYYYVNDPLQEKGNIKVEKGKLERSFDSLGRQVVGIEIYDITELQGDIENR